MRLEQLPAVAAIEAQVAPFGWSEALFLATLKEGSYDCRVLLLAEEVVGYTISAQVLDEGHLHNLAIHPNYQGRGLGRWLLLEVVNRLTQSGVRVLFLEVRISNIVAMSLYARIGFEQIAIRRDYYPAAYGREDGVIMRLSLNE
ncbi:ribosomal-protein-alanine N-acetyltransferase [Ectothiorhodospiraceae bacterium BW-2]|nr:ribosomal-protein-alanine N-acetyltransferase [Ectothiorhodospiraceae bacterium BW-2]